ncbi:MAG: hypothetical protein ACLQO7_14565 [Candidatus Bathyarchaeia archaeon]
MNFKRKLMVTATCLIIAVVAVTLFIVINQPSQSMVAYKAQAQKIFNDAYGAWEQIRNGSLPKVQLEVVTKQWAINTWGKGYAQQNVQAITIEQNIYQGLFLIPQNRSLYQATVDWAGDYVAATWEGKIWVVKENFDPWDLPGAEATFVHELTHIWQSGIPSATTFDEDKAHTALIEGDATFMADTYTNLTKEGLLNTPAPSSTSSYPADIIALGEVHPDTLSNIDYFPYTDGENFVNALHQNGGFATVNQAYTQGYVPSTTAQILNPQEYFENVTAKPVTLPTPTGGNWTQMQTSYGQNYNTYGEYFIEDLLGNWLPQSQAQIISNGWTGDNFTYYQGGGNSGNYLFIWNIQWNNSSLANAFMTAFQTVAKDAQAQNDGNNLWFSNSRYLSISLNSNVNSTFLACSTLQAAVQTSHFS